MRKREGGRGLKAASCGWENYIIITYLTYVEHLQISQPR